RRRLPDHRFDRQPPPRPPQSTIPQLTSLLINNAGALPLPRISLGFSSSLSHKTGCSKGRV
ncbi:hypothetical protein, partial [Mycobacterium ulcerans]|uniref:hypothetical protein n=1 Tax=Mycobacterium ulcerans TaxID=1809 RepID=UPI001A8ED146